MRRVTVTVKIPSGLLRAIKVEAARWGVSIDDTINDLVGRQLSKNANDDRAMQIIRDAAALIEKK